MAHLVMNDQEVLVRSLRAHFDAHVVAVHKVPGARVAHHLSSVARPLEHRVLPEFLRHRMKSERLEKLVAFVEHFAHCVVLVLITKHNLMHMYYCISACV